MASTYSNEGPVVRITRVDSPDAEGRILKVEGRIAGAWAQELSQTTGSELAECDALALDLSGVTFVDREGADVLQALRARGVAFVNATAFVASLLGGETS